MIRKDHGFTLMEVIVVMVLISVIATAVFSRSITTGQINFAGQAEIIVNHVHYAQSMAMKRNEVWGVNCPGGDYWLFQYNGPGDDLNNKKLFPGYDTEMISLSDQNMSSSFFVLFFDGIGKPYFINLSTPLAVDLKITLSSSETTQSKDFYITPETGLLRQ